MYISPRFYFLCDENQITNILLLQTLAGLLRQAKAGKPVNEEEIPPAVAMGASVAVAEPPRPTASGMF